MGLLDKSAILAATDLPFEDVPVPAWGGSVRVRTMTGQERDDFRASLAGEGGAPVGKFSAALLACTMVGENGDRLFSIDEIELILAKSAASLDAPAAVAARLNGLGPTSVEDAAKNSESGQSDDSGSDLPKN